MIKRIFTLMLLTLLVASCSKSEPTYNAPAGDDSISFATDDLIADWGTKSATRGVAVEEINDVPSIMVYSFISNPSATAPYINHVATAIDTSTKIWSFNPSYYYPQNQTLDFLAYTPEASEENGITQTLDFDNKKVTFGYETPLSGRQHPDLLLAEPKSGCSADNEVGTLDFKHVLTKITMSARMASTTEAQHLDRYKITAFTFHDIKTSAYLDYTTTAIGDWYDGEYGDFIVSSILPEGDASYPSEVATLLNKTDKPVMNNGEALFMIPQPIEESTNTNGKPSIQITITDSQTTDIKEGDETTPTPTHLTYRTDMIELPSYNREGWKKGQAIDIVYEFTFDEDMVVIPMSLTAKLMPWTIQTVDKEVDPNIYAWLDVKSVAAGSTTTLKLYTNGEIDEPAVGATLGDKNGNYYPVTVVAGDAGTTQKFTVVINNSHDSKISKTFYINVE